MLIVGCDFHTRFQQIAMMDSATGELVERRLEHGTGEAEVLCCTGGSLERGDRSHHRHAMVRKDAHSLWA
jgi:hypothetical protein